MREMSALSYDETKGPHAIAATRRPSPAAEAMAWLGESLAKLRADFLRTASAKAAMSARWLRQQTEFNQIMRFVMAIPLVAGTATPVAHDYRPPAPEAAIASTKPETPPAPTLIPPVQTNQSTTAAQTTTVALAPAQAPAVAEPVPGPRVKANCSRGTRTVFLDDRPAIEATEDWKEGLTQRYQGAVCSFVPRFGLPEPGFRTYEAPAIEPKRVERANEETPAADPIKVRTTVEREMFDPNMDAPQASPSRGSDADGIERALAALGAPVAERSVGGRVPNERAKAAIAELASADSQDVILAPQIKQPSKPAPREALEVPPEPVAKRAIAIRWSETDPQLFPAYLNYRWTSGHVEELVRERQPLLEDELYFPSRRSESWTTVFGEIAERSTTGELQRHAVSLAVRTRTDWLRGAGVVVATTPITTWPTPAPIVQRQAALLPRSSAVSLLSSTLKGLTIESAPDGFDKAAGRSAGRS